MEMASVDVDLRSADGVPAENDMIIEWRDLTASVTTEDKSKLSILKGVSGRAVPGRLLAILGSSGAGKTTLLNILAGVSSKRVSCTGTVLVNGEQRVRQNFMPARGYCTQDDVVTLSATPREILIFSALLRLPATLDRREKLRRVEETIAVLRLGGCADTPIGSQQGGGISGGERKRTCIGVEVCAPPVSLPHTRARKKAGV